MDIFYLIRGIILVLSVIPPKGTLGDNGGGQGRLQNTVLQTLTKYRELVKEALELAEQKVNIEQHGKDQTGMNEIQAKTGKLKHVFREGDTHDVKYIEYNAFVLEKTKQLLEDMTGITFTELQNSKLFTDVFRSVMHTYCHQPTVKCDETSKYRTIDGSCNNLENPDWGQSYTSKPRYMRPNYKDGVLLPRTTGVDGEQLPNVRLISNVMMKSIGGPVYEEGNLTIMMMAWGQFITHDMMMTPPTADRNNLDIDCCKDPKISSQCFNIDVPANDDYFNLTCLNFTRATPGPYRKCLLQGREQINAQTSFIDASNVYGASRERNAELRTFVGGEMRVKEDNLPPEDKNPHSCLVHYKSHYCLRAGDDRVNVLPNLQALHTLFLREHNRIAKILAGMNKHWTDEKIFQETRKIIGGIHQHITYTQYLPNVLNQTYLKDFQLKEVKGDVYNDTINPSIRNEFGAAAFRFGHSQVPRFMAYVFPNYTYGGKIDIKGLYGNPQIMEDNHGEHISEFFRWMSRSWLYKVDRFIEDSARNYLFFQDGRSFDLASINIQRGRDQGIPPYNKWRELCGLSTAKHFDITDEGLVDHSQITAKLLDQLYRHPNDIDLYVGGLSEEHIPDGLVGPTFACIIARQFRDLKLGDRFWYERHDVPTAFPKDQLEQIKKAKLSKIICNNTKIGQIQPDVFRNISKRNKLQSCDTLPDIDLSKWKEDQHVAREIK